MFKKTNNNKNPELSFWGKHSPKVTQGFLSPKACANWFHTFATLCSSRQQGLSSPKTFPGAVLRQTGGGAGLCQPDPERGLVWSAETLVARPEGGSEVPARTHAFAGQWPLLSQLQEPCPGAAALAEDWRRRGHCGGHSTAGPARS